jgi:hypothetical protein
LSLGVSQAKLPNINPNDKSNEIRKIRKKTKSNSAHHFAGYVLGDCGVQQANNRDHHHLSKAVDSLLRVADGVPRMAQPLRTNKTRSPATGANRLQIGNTRSPIHDKPAIKMKRTGYRITPDHLQ